MEKKQYKTPSVETADVFAMELICVSGGGGDTEKIPIGDEVSPDSGLSPDTGDDGLWIGD